MASISLRHGSEGPHHDPYGFTEIEFVRTDGVCVTYHFGLGEWCEVSKSPKRLRRSPTNRVCRLHNCYWQPDVAETLFECATGLTVKQAMRIAHKLEYPTRCRKCGSRKLKGADGYPGESFTVCAKCDAILASHFHESEII